MRLSLSLFPLLFGAVAWAGSAQSQQPPQTQPNAEHGAEQQKAAAQDANGTAMRDEQQPADDAIERNTACDDRNSDLCQQARMAYAAEELLVLTRAEIAFLVLTFLGTIGLGVISIRANHRQLRAYMTLAGLEVSEPYIGEKMRYTVSIKNTGQTPAKGVAAAHALVLRSLPLSEALPDMRGKLSEKAPRRDVGAGETSTPGGDADKAIDAKGLEMFDAGKAEFYLLGRVEYRDVFRRKRWTDFRHVGRVDSEGNIRWWTCEEGNQSN